MKAGDYQVIDKSATYHDKHGRVLSVCDRFDVVRASTGEIISCWKSKAAALVAMRSLASGEVTL